LVPSGTTEIVIYGRASGQSGGTLRLVVARVSTTPPVLRTPDIQRRQPRPDDPTPRKPPLTYFGVKRPRESSDASSESVFGDPIPTGKKVKAGPPIIGKSNVVSDQDVGAQRRARDVMLGLHRSSSVSSTTSRRSSSVSGGIAKSGKKQGVEDPFKIPSVPANRKGKERADFVAPSGMVAPSPESNHYEEVNKLVSGHFAAFSSNLTSVP
jgi:hypothetical protein